VLAKQSLNSEFYWEPIHLTSFFTNVGTNRLMAGRRDKGPKSGTVPPRSGRMACMQEGVSVVASTSHVELEEDEDESSPSETDILNAVYCGVQDHDSDCVVDFQNENEMLLKSFCT